MAHKHLMSRAESYKIQTIVESAYPLKPSGDEYEPLLELVGDATLVLLGESSHGTHEFYRERAQITKQLIHKKGFKAVAIEGDWPDAHRVHRFAVGQSQDTEAVDALSGFTRFPSWMWANADMLDFVGWLRCFNESLSEGIRPVGFYGLDLYSLFRSAREVIEYLDRVDPRASERARVRFACLDRFGGDSQKYAYATALGLAPSCEDAVVAQLVDLLNDASVYRQHADSNLAIDEFFNAEQNSRLVTAAEHYYRTMLREEVSSWNLRDQHMSETIEQIRQHLVRHGDEPKVVVWAHNSHLGNAKATEMAHRGEFNVGQLTRDAYGEDVVGIGFTTFHGTVTAASRWDGTTERKAVRPGLDGSYEELFHRTGLPRFFLDLRRGTEAAKVLRDPMLERAIGVIYRPDTERLSHYFHASLPGQFDAIIHIDRTRAVEPLEHLTQWESGAEAPEAFPSGI